MKIMKKLECPCGAEIIIEAENYDPINESTYAFRMKTTHDPYPKYEMCTLIMEQIHNDEIKIMEQRIRQTGSL